ncbi:type II toxin-antitoxin system VapC family toxin [Marinobacter sp. TBZ242]|uniref:Ribonuclease VapC n=1 Tax=Marinobacter azerbaijanicus TaxID=3050455 RepID=A0ABT7IAV3_9GAMM|nr:type II toxin-antitoxin system VapC family toxin [Marinobacter sp. TBZ242]MDL0431296.1 type II toxin-antitoxin system VapC family toxin [Marinobacter sp. TBZ242]
MKYLLDTNICIYLMKHEVPAAKERFEQCFYGDVAISAITLAELQYGIECKPENQEQNEKALERLRADLVVAPFDDNAAIAYGRLRAGIPRDQRRKDALDKLIASHAVALGAVLVTNNEDDFNRYPDVTIENWTR